MWGLCIVVVGHFIQFLHGRHEVCHCRARQIVQRHYKWIGFVPNLLFNVCNQILHPNRNRRTVFQLAKKTWRNNNSRAPQQILPEMEPWNPGVSHHLNTIYFLNWSFFFLITSFGHFLKVWTSSLYILKWQKDRVFHRNTHGFGSPRWGHQKSPPTARRCRVAGENEGIHRCGRKTPEQWPKPWLIVV